MNRKYLFFISQNYSFPILRPLQEAIISNSSEVRWFMYGDEITKNSLRKDEVEIETIEEIIEYNPDAVFVPGNVVPSFIPGLKVQVFHGLPSKKAKKSGQLYHFIIRGMFDLYCTQGSSSTEPFRDLAKKYQYFHIEETGWCKLDPIFPIQSKKSKDKTILFASTFSPRFSKAKLLYPFIEEMIKKHNIKWYITLHPKMDKTTVSQFKSIKSPKVTFIEAEDIIDSFVEADLMLCDTSSIIYEFLTQLKPVITFQTQKEETSIINIKDIDKLEESILSTFNNIDKYKNQIKKEVDKFHPYRDGKSSYRVLSAVENMLNGENIPKKKKPLNIIRNLKLRKELNYWDDFKKWRIL